jgi:hypothetical protein
MAKRVPSWDRLYSGIRLIRRPDVVYFPTATDVELDEAEAQLGSRLPSSYRAFLKRFGSGDLSGFIHLSPLFPVPPSQQDTVVERTKRLREWIAKDPSGYTDSARRSSLIYFASRGPAYFAWDTSEVTQSRAHEYRCYLLAENQDGEEQLVAISDSFWQLVEWTGTARQYRPHVSSPTGVRPDEEFFRPDSLRVKEKPKPRDLKRWLAWNNGTVLNLARSLREEGGTEGFLILADALEEAGCTNLDLINSCRCDTPAIDGSWVLQVLLDHE